MFFKTETSRWRFIKKVFSFQSSTDSLRFISFYNLFDFVTVNTFKSRRFIFIRYSISSCSFSRLCKSRKTKEHSKIRSRRSEWLYIYFIKRHIDSQSFDEIIDHWICVFFDDERYYRCMIDNQFLLTNLMTDSLFLLFERLSSFDFKNDLLAELIEFMINLSDDHLEHLCRSESLTAFSRSSMNVLKKINHSSLWDHFYSISTLLILNIYRDIRLSILFDDDWLNIFLIEISSI